MWSLDIYLDFLYRVLQQVIRFFFVWALHIDMSGTGCPMSFVNHAALPIHFASIHNDLLNNPAILKTGILKRARTPRRAPPTQLSNLPPDLPPAPVLTHPILTPSVALARKRGPSQAPTASQARRNFNKMRGEDFIADEEDEDTPFPELVNLKTEGLKEFTDFVFLRKPPEEIPPLSRPPRLTIPPIPEKIPPASMGFGAFEKRFMELEKAGLLDGTGEWPDEDDATPAPA